MASHIAMILLVPESQARVIIAWLADVTLTYHNQHPEKNEFKMLAQLMQLSQILDFLPALNMYTCPFSANDFPGGTSQSITTSWSATRSTWRIGMASLFRRRVTLGNYSNE